MGFVQYLHQRPNIHPVTGAIIQEVNAITCLLVFLSIRVRHGCSMLLIPMAGVGDGSITQSNPCFYIFETNDPFTVD